MVTAFDWKDLVSIVPPRTVITEEINGGDNGDGGCEDGGCGNSYGDDNCYDGCY